MSLRPNFYFFKTQIISFLTSYLVLNLNFNENMYLFVWEFRSIGHLEGRQIEELGFGPNLEIE